MDADDEDATISFPSLESNESLLALHLAEALRADEAENFLEIYDSIPTSTNTKCVLEIKEMARQLAALPKKQFELYRSKKILSSDHGFIQSGGNQVLKDKLGTNYITGTAYYEMNTVQKGFNVNQTGEFNDTYIPKDNEMNSNPVGFKKKRKPKKGNLPNSIPLGNSLYGGSDRESGKTVDMKRCSATGSDNGFSLNAGCLVGDMSTQTVLKSKRHSETIKVNISSSQQLERGSDDTLKNLTEDIKEVDSGLGSYTSPVLPREPPFGFPPSSQKLLESALGLLPDLSSNRRSISSCKTDALRNSNNPLQLFKDISKETERTSLGLLRTSEAENALPKPQRKRVIRARHEIEDDPISDISDTKEICKEGDSVDGDVSSSSAVEDEEGWQSQIKRSHRKKKKELVASRAGREKNNNGRFQRNDYTQQQADNNQARKNQCHKKAFEDRKNYNCYNSKFVGRKVQDVQNKSENVVVKPSSFGKNGQESVKLDKEINLTTRIQDRIGYFPFGSNPELLGTRRMSYRDALMKNTKKEPVYSSDSGVDANSISSCESTGFSPEARKDLFNKQQCVDYLLNVWKKVISDAKEGLVVCFSIDADPVECEKQRKKHITINGSSPLRC